MNAVGAARPLHSIPQHDTDFVMDSRYSFFRTGRPRWFTALPFPASPGVLAFVLAVARAYALTWAVILLLFPLFSWYHGQEFEFGRAEAFFFGFLFAFFEGHARWNYIINAERPVVAATKFALFITLLELLLLWGSENGNDSFAVVACSRIPALALHLLLGYVAACVSKKSQQLMFGVFVIGVVAHAAFNVFGPKYLSVIM